MTYPRVPRSRQESTEEVEEIEHLIQGQRANQQIDHRVLTHIVRQLDRIARNQEKIMTDLSGIQADEAALGAAQSQEATDVLKALADLEAKINTPGGVTQADIEALRGPIQAALASSQGTDAAAVAADATLNPNPAPGA